MKEEILRDLIKTRDVIRRKYKSLVLGETDTEKRLEKTFKPLSNPIKELIEQSKFNFKKFDENSFNQNKPPKIIKNKSYSTPIKNENLLFKINNDEDDADGKDDDKSFYLSFEENDQGNNSKKASSKTIDNYEKTENDVSSGSDDDDGDDNEKSNYTSSLPQFNSSLHYLTDLDQRRELDLIYGPNKDSEGKWRFGRNDISINHNLIRIGGEKYKLTTGLLNLLFHKTPKKYDTYDLQIYKSIIINNNAHRRNFKTSGQINGNRSYKYTKIIKALIKDDKSKTSKELKRSSMQVSGTGIMQFTNKKSNYIYWDDPNELVARLRLLMASRSSGNNNHNNEIVSIIEELKEADIVK